MGEQNIGPCCECHDEIVEQSHSISSAVTECETCWSMC